MSVNRNSNKINGVDSEGVIRPVSVDTIGRINVITPPPSIPEDTTSVKETAQGDVSGSSTSYTNYTIPNGETLIIQRFQGGAEGDGGASKVSLYYDSTGTGVGTLISVGYCANNSFQYDLNETYIGDGTARIRIARTRIDAGTREIYGRWEGYY